MKTSNEKSQETPRFLFIYTNFLVFFLGGVVGFFSVGVGLTHIWRTCIK